MTSDVFKIQRHGGKAQVLQKKEIKKNKYKSRRFPSQPDYWCVRASAYLHSERE